LSIELPYEKEEDETNGAKTTRKKNLRDQESRENVAPRE
jgi:hypothetical protein